MGDGALARVWAVVLHDLRLLRRDPVFVVIWVTIPVVFMAFNKQMYAASLTVDHLRKGFNGAEQVVPGATVLFSGFLVGNLGVSIYREHGWGTWDRLRASQLSTAEILVAKSITPGLILLFQLVVLLVGGTLLLDLNVRGSLAAFAAVAAALALVQMAFSFMLLALCHSVMELNGITVAAALLLGGLSGAFTPVEFLPSWARVAAPATPAYWAMRGFRSVLLDGQGLAAIALPTAVLLAFASAFAIAAARRFRVDDAKVA